MNQCARFDALQAGGDDMNTETRNGHSDMPAIVSTTSPTLDPQRVTLSLKDNSSAHRAAAICPKAHDQLGLRQSISSICAVLFRTAVRAITFE